MTTTNHILVTSEEGSFEQTKLWCLENNAKFTAQSFIEVLPVLDLEIPLTDWIFFSSPKGARLYLKHYPVHAKHIAVLGEGTGKVVRDFDLKIDFTGPSDKSPHEVGLMFEEHLHGAPSIFFPLSQLSKKTVVNALQKTKAVTLNTYTTNLLSIESQHSFSTILFTSPSNFNAYIAVNSIGDGTRIVAIGKTTAKAISKTYPDFAVHTLDAPNDKAFLRFLSENY